ncbi:MAG: glycosyltransferase family 4 protein [Acidobacteriia bacterium]|nr:glycosyltransferase family 4 protein [Terriglobia bacterium]
MTTALLSDARWIGLHGIGRFAAEVLRRLPLHPQLKEGPRPLSPCDALWTAWQVRHRRPRAYFSPGFNPPPLCPAPLVFTIHDLLQIRAPEVATAAKRAYYAAIVGPACRRAFRVLTVSEHSRTQILEWTGLREDRVVNVGNGVGEPFVPDGERYDPGYRYILYAGNFRPHKNLARLFAAFRDLPEPDLRLLLTGDPDTAILRSVEQFGVPGRTKFAGRISDAALARLYRGAELVVLPSLSEGFGLPALEAMACGAPVVASRAGALPEVVGPAGILVDPLETGEIRRGMERVLADAELRTAMKRAGIERARLFAWDDVAARVRAVLEEAS